MGVKSRGSEKKKGVEGQKVLQCPPWCHISFVTQKHRNHPGQTREDAAIYT